MSHPASNRDNLATSPHLRVTACRACAASLEVSPAARYCPRCGAPLPAEAVRPSDSDAADRLVAICQAEQCLPPAPGTTDNDLDADVPLARALTNFHSDVLTAYASAMFRLGWRYERGHGSHRNPAEAIRCYCKAARLGSADAVARLSTAPPPLPPPAPRMNYRRS